MMGAVSATAVAVGLTPPMANAASSQTYFIGFPSWLPIGAGSTLPSDPNAISAAILAAKDKNPLIGWGTGGVNLQPVYVTWVDGVPQYTLPVVGQTGSHTTTNPVYQPAYDAAYNLAYNYNVAYGIVYAQISQAAYNTAYARGSAGCGGWSAAICRAAAATTAAAEAKSVADAQAPAAATAQATQIALAAALAAIANIPKTVTVPDYGITDPGNWTTTTAGQWVSPSDLSTLPTAGQLAYLISAAQNGDTGALAPLLNWTAYLTNVNLIAYGDGAIAAGQAYQSVIDSAKNGTFPVGTAQTGPRQIAIVGPDGKVTLVTVYDTNNPIDYPNPTYPAAGDPPDYEVTQPGGVLDLTVLSLVLVRNPGRANGGLYARFAPIYQELTGVNPVTPERQDVLPAGLDPATITKLLSGDTSDITLDELGNLQAVLNSADGKPMIVTLKADIGWEYDLMSDAPAAANPIAWANSVASSIFLTNLLTGVDFQDLGTGGYVDPKDGTIYYTIPVDQLPLLTPLRLPAQLIGLATGQNIDTPVADAIEPFLKILVNSAYTDVQRNPDGTWTRTLDQFGTPTLFGTQTLTRDQQVLMAGDLVAALGAGVGDELTDALLRTKDQLTKTFNVDLTDPQDTALEQALAAPGTTIKTVSRNVGDDVSQVLASVESHLPETPAVTQADLADAQQAIGEQLANTRDQINDTVTKANETVTKVNDTVTKVESAIAKEGTKITTAISSAGGKHRAAPSATRKTPVKDAVKKATSDIKKAVTKVSDNVKKALGGGKAGAA
jgi:hypothetical protein